MFWDILQTVGLLTSFLYLWLEFHQKPSMWIVSACCSVIYASIYCHAKIYGDMGFSLFNICMCAYGFWKWYRLHATASRPEARSALPHEGGLSAANASERPKIIYRHFRPAELGIVLTVTAAIWFALSMALRHLTDSPVPVLDAFTTTLNIVGTWVLAQKIIEVWGCWFLVNLVSIYLYCKRGLHFTTILLYTFYLGASVYGYWKWRHYGQCVRKAVN